jgi:23S rRNA (uridine2552-2'-O)-methyltransferase
MAKKSGASRGSGRGSSKRSGGGKGRTRDGFIKKGNARYDRHDAYYRKAKKDGYAARSVYKLEEIDQAFKIVRRGNRVLDLGSAPGSWLQYAQARVGEQGIVVGVDLLPLQVSPGPRCHVLQGDVFDLSAEELLPEGEVDLEGFAGFDVVLSDMAPNTTGIKSVDQDRSMALCERAFDLALRLLRPGGRFCVKVLEGGDMPEFLKRCRAAFSQVKIRRPKGTRAGSMETYVVGLDLKKD